MSPLLKELQEIAKSLPQDKAAELRDFARFLKEQTKSGSPRKLRTTTKKANGVATWDRMLNNPRPRPKLEAEIARGRKAVREGETIPLDIGKL